MSATLTTRILVLPWYSPGTPLPIAQGRGAALALALDVQGACTLLSGNVTGKDALP